MKGGVSAEVPTTLAVDEKQAPDRADCRVLPSREGSTLRRDATCPFRARCGDHRSGLRGSVRELPSPFRPTGPIQSMMPPLRSVASRLYPHGRPAERFGTDESPPEFAMSFFPSVFPPGSPQCRFAGDSRPYQRSRKPLTGFARSVGSNPTPSVSQAKSALQRQIRALVVTGRFFMDEVPGERGPGQRGRMGVRSRPLTPAATSPRLTPAGAPASEPTVIRRGASPRRGAPPPTFRLGTRAGLLDRSPF